MAERGSETESPGFEFIFSISLWVSLHWYGEDKHTLECTTSQGITRMLGAHTQLCRSYVMDACMHAQVMHITKKAQKETRAVKAALEILYPS